MSRRRMFGDSGMTLVEIMIVIILIGVVAVALFSGIKKMANSARRKTAENQIRVIENAMDVYYNDYGYYPDTLDELVGNDSGEGYIDERQLNDPWGHPLQYDKSGGEGYDYKIWSEGPKVGKESDNINSWELGKKRKSD